MALDGHGSSDAADGWLFEIRYLDDKALSETIRALATIKFV